MRFNIKSQKIKHRKETNKLQKVIFPRSLPSFALDPNPPQQQENNDSINTITNRKDQISQCHSPKMGYPYIKTFAVIRFNKFRKKGNDL